MLAAPLAPLGEMTNNSYPVLGASGSQFHAAAADAPAVDVGHALGAEGSDSVQETQVVEARRT
jgi:hypothetical protein